MTKYKICIKTPHGDYYKDTVEAKNTKAAMYSYSKRFYHFYSFFNNWHVKKDISYDGSICLRVEWSKDSPAGATLRYCKFYENMILKDLTEVSNWVTEKDLEMALFSDAHLVYEVVDRDTEEPLDCYTTAYSARWARYVSKDGVLKSTYVRPKWILTTNEKKRSMIE